MDAIITINDLSKIYRVGNEKVRALSHISLQIGRGEICCILGTSGSGKSTLLNQLAGLEKPTAGSVRIGKTNISRLSEDQLAGFRQRNIGFVFQSYNLIASMSALENVAMPLLFRGTPRMIRDREAAQMLKKVGLGNRINHKPSEMSGGQQQRVGIARAFVAKPKIVFADEPTGNLDSHTTLEVMKLLIEMSHQNNITFVLVTHDNELARYADRIITIRDGLLVGDEHNDSPAYLEKGGDAAVSTKHIGPAPEPQKEQQAQPPSTPQAAAAEETPFQPPQLGPAAEPSPPTTEPPPVVEPAGEKSAFHRSFPEMWLSPPAAKTPATEENPFQQTPEAVGSDPPAQEKEKENDADENEKTV